MRLSVTQRKLIVSLFCAWFMDDGIKEWVAANLGPSTYSYGGTLQTA
jgi:hypothetical protein